MKIKAMIAAAMMIILCGCGGDIAADMADMPEQTEQPVQDAVQTVISEHEYQTDGDEGIYLHFANGTRMIISDCGGAYPEPCPIEMSSADDSIFDGLFSGDRIKIGINTVFESYPAKTEVYSLEKLGGNGEIPDDIISRLRDMGYTDIWPYEGTVLIYGDYSPTPMIILNGSPVEMFAADKDSSIFDGLATGDKIIIETDGILESYPGQTYVYGLEKLSSGSIDDIPEKVIRNLEELCGNKADEDIPDENTQLCMIGGVVYRNTGKTNNVPRCGNLDGAFDEVIDKNAYPTKDGQANFTAYGFQWGMEEYTIEVCIDDNWYVFEPLDNPSVNEPTESYPHFKYDTVSRITVTPGSYVPMGKDPIEVPEGIKQDLAKLIEVCKAVPTEKPAEELDGGGYIVTVYNSDGKSIEYNFWNEEIFVVDGIYYSIERAYGINIMSIITSVVHDAEEAERSDEIKVDEITPLSKEEDLQLRTDYAAYVSARNEGRQVSAEDVYGKFYFGTFDGYKIVVMCPSECYTDDIGVHRLRYTDADIIDPSCDCYPYIDIELPSGMFELLAYKDGTFISVEKALETKMIDYSLAMIIENYMDAYHQGNRMCAYNISCWQ